MINSSFFWAVNENEWVYGATQKYVFKSLESKNIKTGGGLV